MATRSIQSWFNEYGESHRDHTNKLIHWVCVPTIYFCVIGLLASIPPPSLPAMGPYPWAWIASALVVFVFYFPRSLPLGIGMAICSYLCMQLVELIDARSAWPLWAVCTFLFALAWIGQFIGHRIEGKKPSFLKDLQFLLIGPAWLLGSIYRRLGISY